MGDLEREKEFYRQQYNDLGKQFLHLQQQNTLVKRETRRTRVLLELIRDSYALSASFPSMAAIRRKFMLVVLGALGVDRVAVLTYLPMQKAFTVQGSLGFPKDMKSQFTPEKLPGEFHFMNSTSTIDPVLESLRRFMGVPYLLWTFNLRHEIAFVVGNATEDKMMHLPFEKADREIVEGALTVFIDIMESKRAEEQIKAARHQAEASNRAKSDFLANMSHELRTPLNHIIGFTELVKDKVCGELNETQEEYLGDVLDSSRHLLSLINDILDLSKVEAGKLTLELTDIDLKALLEGSLTMIREKVMKQGIHLSTDIQDIPETVIADKRKLNQIIYNLLSNAVKFNGRGGNICLSAQKMTKDEMQKMNIAFPGTKDLEREINEFIEISVTDTGIGIEPEDLERIFNPFEQVESSTSRKFQGTGLGLPLTRQLVELHHGTIWVESRGEGKGSSFRFLIPVFY